MKDAGHILIHACAVLALACGDCPDAFEVRERRELGLWQRVRLTVPDGELEVAGRERTTSLEIAATGCGADVDARIEFDATGDTLLAWINAARADVRLRLPAGVPLDVRHGSGDVRLRDTGPATVATEDGRAVVERTIGDVRVMAGAGALHLRDVLGDVDVLDGAGPLFIDRIGGNVRVRDGPGGIHVRDVDGDVVVEADEAGAIDVRRVGGDFVVRSKSADRRLIRYGSVSGRFLLSSDLLPP